VDDVAQIDAMMARVRASLRENPGAVVEDRAPEVDVITIRTDRTRTVIRPSGTEPKLKAYLEVVEPVADGDVATSRTRAQAALRDLRAETAALLGV
jgi:phosphomannomutase